MRGVTTPKLLTLMVPVHQLLSSVCQTSLIKKYSPVYIAQERRNSPKHLSTSLLKSEGPCSRGVPSCGWWAELAFIQANPFKTDTTSYLCISASAVEDSENQHTYISMKLKLSHWCLKSMHIIFHITII